MYLNEIGTRGKAQNKEMPHKIYGYQQEVSDVQSFPKPLNADEEKKCLERLRQNDKAARDILIEKNLRLVAYIAKKYASKECEMEDLISIGTVGLIKGIDNFNEDKQIRLATFCSRCIENEMLMHFRSEKKQSRDVYLNEPIGADKEGNEIALIDILEYIDEDVTERLELEANIIKLRENIKKVLSQRELEIICLRYGFNKSCREFTQREIAAMMDISRSYVSRIEKKALEKLRKCF